MSAEINLAELEQFFREKKGERFFDSEFAALSTEDQKVLGELFLSLKPSISQCRNFLKSLSEVSKRDEISFGEIWEGSEIAQLVSDETLSRSEKLKAFGEIVERLRYPERTALRDQLQEKRKEMRRSYGVDVGFPANLEGLSLETTIRYRSIEELGKHAESLSRLANSEDIKGMFELLKGEEV